MRWEYRVHTTGLSPDDKEASQLLTNVSRPALHESPEAGWEVFQAEHLAGGQVRLYMKREAVS